MTHNRPGRPAKPYQTSWGETIHGLRRRPTDGRWEITAPWAKGRKFTEPDERQAIDRFEAMKPAPPSEDKAVSLPQRVVDRGLVDVGVAVKKHFSQSFGHNIQTTVGDRPLKEWQLDGEHATASAEVLQSGIWEHLRRELIERPDWVAERLNIPEIAKLEDVQVRPASHTLRAVGNLYQEHARAGDAWKKKVARYWKEFCKLVQVNRLRDLTPVCVQQYGEAVLNKGMSPTYARQRFAAIKGVVGLARRHGVDQQDYQHAQECLTVLTPPPARKPQPMPIAPEDFHELLGHADRVMKAALLLGLNCCMYGSEVAALQWEDIDLERCTLVTQRPKTGVLRVAILWDVTRDCLQHLPSARRRQGRVLGLTGVTLRRRFWDLRQASGVRDIPGVGVQKLPGAEGKGGVQFQHLRDGAYTAAVQGEGVQLAEVAALAGHSTGIADHYLARRPQMVDRACRAVAEHYGMNHLEAIFCGEK